MSLLDQFDMNEEERSRRLEFLEFTDEDRKSLRSIHALAIEHADEVVEKLYDHLMKHEQTRSFFVDPKVLRRVKKHQRKYFLELTEGTVDSDYFENRFKVGDAHQRIELLPQWYLGLYSLYSRLILDQIRQQKGDAAALDVASSLLKLVFLDVGLAMDAYIQGGFIEKLRRERSVSAELREELARKEKLAFLGQLAGGVGHELRNPLAVIQTSAYFLKMAVESDNPKVNRHIDILEQEIANANEIISNLLDFSRTRRSQPSRFGLDQLVREVTARCDLTNVRAQFQLDEVEVLADRGQIGQVVGNVINNAIQAMPEGGDLRLATRRVDGHGELVVEDSGEGIAPNQMEKIFQPLFTTKTKGIGLGLAVCDTLIRANGGSISVESESGRGACFTVSLPVGE